MLAVPAVPAAPPSPSPSPRSNPANDSAKTDAADSARADASNSSAPSGSKPKSRKDDFAQILHAMHAATPTLGLAESTSWMSLRRIEAPPSASTSGDDRRIGSSDDDANSASLTALGSASATLQANRSANSASGANGAATAKGPVTANGIADAIAGKLDEAKANGRVDLHLQLDPPELGKVRIQVTATDRQMSLRVVVQDDAARQTIQAQAGTLRERLGNLGVSLGRLDVRQDGGSANPRQPADQSGQNAAAGTFGAGRRSAASALALTGRRTPAPTATGVDVIV